MYGLHVPAVMPAQRAADKLLALRAAEDRNQFESVAKAAIKKLGPHVPDKDAVAIIDSMYRCAMYDPDQWRRNVAMTLERIRNGWGVE